MTQTFRAGRQLLTQKKHRSRSKIPVSLTSKMLNIAMELQVQIKTRQQSQTQRG